MFTKQEIEKSISNLEMKLTVNKELSLEALNDNDRVFFDKQIDLINARIKHLKEMLYEAPESL